MESGPGFLSLVSPVLTLAGAPLLQSFVLKIKALFAGRKGPPVLQVYYDIIKCLRKGVVYSSSASWISRVAPSLIFAAIAISALFMPSTAWGSPLSFSGDIFVFIYLLALARFLTLVLALDCGSSFESMGASREAFFSSLAEPVLLLAMGALAKTNHQFSLTALFGGTGFGIVVGLLAGVSLFVVLLAENCRVPVDDPATHLELTMIHEVMILDQSGPELGWILYGAAVKFWLFCVLAAQALLPVHGFSAPAQTVMLLAMLFLVAAAVGVVESTLARLRLARVPQLLVGAGALAALALLFGNG